MSEMTALRSLVAEKLSAAVEEIFSAVERMIPEKKKKLHTEEMSVEQQRAVVHRRLSVVADEICRILETIMAQHEAEVSCSQEEMQSHHQLLDVTLKTETSSRRTDKLLLHVSGCENDFSSELQKCDQSWSTGQVEKTSDPLQIKDASTETDCDLIHSKTSHLHQREEKGSWTVETETRGETVSDQEALSLRDSEAVVEDNETDEELDKKPNKRKTQGADCVKRHGKKRKITPANKIQTVGQSCCRVCGKLFRYKRSFLKHVLTHEQSSDLCGACGKHLDSDESLKVHLQTHNDANICRDQKESDAESKVENSDEDWRDSEGTDDEKEGSRVGNQSKIKGGKNKDLSNLKYRCKVCEKSFTYRTSFLKHVQEEEGDADLCGVCGRPFKSKKSLRLHLQTYIRTNDCEVCGKHFDGHQQLEMHMRTHTGEKPYVCAVCGKAFAQNGNLMGHMRVHTGERPYICSVCGQSFSFKEYMTAHMRIHTGEKPFLCSYCGKGFRQRGTLKTHMMIHTGESTHQCPVCDKKFYKSGALKIHMRSHTGEKPYLCNVCGKSFQASGSLTKHMGIHEGERTHRCSICGKGFLRKDDLKRHAQTHGDESTQLTSL